MFLYWFIAARSKGLGWPQMQLSTKCSSSGTDQILSEEYPVYQFRALVLGHRVDSVTLWMSSVWAQCLGQSQMNLSVLGGCHLGAFLSL